MTIPINPNLKDLKPYPPGKPIEEVQRELGLDHVIKLASNENPLGPSPRATEALRAAAESFHLYPDGNAHALREAMSEHLGLGVSHLIFGNGSDELLMLAALTYLTPETELIMSQHAFIRPLMHAQMVGAQVKIIPVIPRNCEQDVEAMAFAIGGKTRIVYLANPNNPTGDLVDRDRLHGLLTQVPEDCLFILDEAYFEYCAGDDDYQDSLKLIEEFPNLLVLRTFSKAYGLAGLRCGYGFAQHEVIQAIERVRPPFNLTRSAQVAAIAALGDTEHLRKSIEVNRAGMKQLVEGLDDLPVDVLPSRGNFVLFEAANRPCQELFNALLRRGVIVRPMGGYGFPCGQRVSVGTEEENALFLRALREALEENA